MPQPRVPSVRITDTVHMPQLGLGVYQIWKNDLTTEAVKAAIAAGYRSIDTAAFYRNEDGVGRAVAESGLPREDLFVTTKLHNADHGYDATLRAFDASMDRLGMEYLDLYLIHWPRPSVGKYLETWRAFEKLLADGRVRAIGVSNFVPDRLAELAEHGSVVPAVDQIELHPWFAQRAARDYHRRHGIVTQAWSPLAQGGRFLADPVLTEIGAAHGKSVAQVILRWHIQLGNVVIPKSVTPARIAENIDIFDFELSPAEMARVDALDDGTRTGPDPETQ